MYIYKLYVNIFIYTIHICCAETCSKQISVHIAGSFVRGGGGSLTKISGCDYPI